MLTVDLVRAGVRPGSVVLDLGCGGGRHAYAALRAGARVVALDSSGAALEPVNAMIAALFETERLPGGATASVVVGDARHLPFPDDLFDCVIASEVLEHIVEDDRVIAELARVLRAGGVLSISVPRFLPEAVCWMLSARYHANEGGHVRIYRLTQLLARLSRAGLVLSGRHYAHGLHSPYWWLRCLVGLERDDNRLVAAYHRLLVWEIEKAPVVTRIAARVLDPLVGKSLVLYVVHAKAPGVT